MYESPIKIVEATTSRKLEEQMENLILEEVRKVGVMVDRDELIRALTYDRGQFDRGFAAGYDEGYEKGKRDFMRLLHKFMEEN